MNCIIYFTWIYSQGKLKNTAAQKLTLLKAAAKLIKSNINGVRPKKLVYTNPDDVSVIDCNKEFVPESLLLFLRELFSAKDADVKLCSIGQAIMQACCHWTIIALRLAETSDVTIIGEDTEILVL